MYRAQPVLDFLAGAPHGRVGAVCMLPTILQIGEGAAPAAGRLKR